MALTSFLVDDIVSRESINQRISEFDSFFPLKISDGGTGATSAAGARKNLGIYTVESISFSGEDTLTLSRSIREYSYIRVYYNSNPVASGYKWLYGSTYFSQDVLASTDIHALCINDTHNDYMMCLSALMHVSGSGYTIWLDRNKGFMVNRLNGNTYIDTNSKIKISAINGYK